MRAPFALSGIDYPLGHLDSFLVKVPAKEPLAAPATLRVTSSCHVFSEKWDHRRHSSDCRIEEDGETRAFCAVRYGCSIALPSFIRHHVGGKAYEKRDGNGFLNKFFYCEAEAIPYPVYFRLTRADRMQGVDGILHVVSAYQCPSLRARRHYPTIKFARLVHQTCPPAPIKR